MSLTLTLTGTGGAQGVPAWGCECAACARARRSPQYRRQPCSGVVKFNDAITLIDAGRTISPIAGRLDRSSSFC